MVAFCVLFEHAVGYSLYRVNEFEEVGSMMPQVEAAVQNKTKFMDAVKMVSFRPFENAAESLNNINAVSEGIMTDVLEAFLTSNNFGQGTAEYSGILGVSCPVLGQAIKEATGAKVMHTGVIPEVCRGIRLFLPKYIKGLSFSSMKQAELGLGHSYSRSKVKFNVNRVDNMIIQSIAINDQLDKDINTFAMRLREWYSYHFPELSRIVDDHHTYARVVKYIKNRNNLTDDSIPELVNIVQNDDKAEEILSAARMSMGMDIMEADLINIQLFTERIINLTEFRRSMSGYLNRTMKNVAPNLGVVVGDQVAARLISHAGSLTNLAKLPASTVQILGAEKALFRALKTKSNTPKYGLIYNSSFIGRAAITDKGRISRFLANKCSIASRIDCFSEVLTSTFGESLKQQIEDRLKFYSSGDIPRKNIEVMAEAQELHNMAAKALVKASKKKKRSEALLASDLAMENGLNSHQEVTEEEEKRIKKEKKKRKKESRKSMACLEEVKDAAEEEVEEAAQEEVEDMETAPPPKKKKKKKHRESI